MYVDGFVAAVPNANKEQYRAYAELAAEVFKAHGALHVMECWGVDVPDGKLTSFPMAVQKKEDETVVFSWITWPDKESHDKGFAAMMNDPRFDMKTNPMPFDGKRMIYGSFEPILER